MAASSLSTTPGSRRGARDRHRIERAVLGNGLRLVLCPDRDAPVACVTVVYGVGSRTEPAGRSGFAHLFEHLMFQGSTGVDRSGHARHVQGAGGSFTGSTHFDYTQYTDVAPSNALERLLYLEADRMRRLRLTERSLANQVRVVQEEIRDKVLSRPYGGFPWPRLAPVMFESFADRHDGYGAFADLEAATLEDAAAFFERHYSSANAVVCVCGDVDPDRALRLLERHFGDVQARPAPPAAAAAEPEPTGGRRASVRVPEAPLPALAWAWRLPDPVARLALFLPNLLVAELLAGSCGARLTERLVNRDGGATTVSGRVGFLGDPLGVRDPTVLVFQARLPAHGDPEKVLLAADEETERLAADGPGGPELSGARARVTASLLRETDSVTGRALRMAVFELQRADPGLVCEIPDLLAGIDARRVRDAAARLTADRRATLELVPGGAKEPGGPHGCTAPRDGAGTAVASRPDRP
jgi:zinc protease